MPVTIKPYLDIQFDKPKVYLVSIISIDYVSWDFCLRILRNVFHKSPEDSVAIADEIIRNGEAICGGYIFEIAQTKAVMVEKQAQKEKLSMMCLLEEV